MLGRTAAIPFSSYYFMSLSVLILLSEYQSHSNPNLIPFHLSTL